MYKRQHLGSGRTYHLRYNPPRVAGKDDLTGEDLIQRDDDQEETVRKRLEVYDAQTRPLVEYYSSWANKTPVKDEVAVPQYRKIEGLGTVEEITVRAFSALR